MFAFCYSRKGFGGGDWFCGQRFLCFLAEFNQGGDLLGGGLNQMEQCMCRRFARAKVHLARAK